MQLTAILDNLRSIENVGSIFRTSDALSVEKLLLCGATPHPHPDESWRRDHLTLKKTALGAENSVAWEYFEETQTAVATARQAGYQIVALETGPKAVLIQDFKLTNKKIALILGNEVLGINPDIQHSADIVVQIPMAGIKESLNVAVSFGIAGFWLRYHV